jgi:arsenite-transporting ATPase
MKTFLDEATPFLFFTGKGGVGKTSLACATAIGLADAGKLVLLVSTDPASNLSDVLKIPLTNSPTPVAGVPNLWALVINPERAAIDYRERVLAPFLPTWTPKQVAQARAQLADIATVEVAVVDEFVELLVGGSSTESFDHVVFDTAATGHTLRLLWLPHAWAEFLQTVPPGEAILGAHASLKARQPRFAAAMNTLADPSRTTMILVARPDLPSLREADRSSRELDALGITSQHVAINCVFTAAARADTVALALEARGAAALQQLPYSLASRPTVHVPLRAYAVVGLVALRALLNDKKSALLLRAVSPRPIPLTWPLASLIDELERPGHGLVMVIGKGGVGKTTIAASIAVELASRGHAVELSTTDPAAHVAATLAGHVENLVVARIDPVVETKAYVERELATTGANLDEAGRALLAEKLRSPWCEEAAVLFALSRTIVQARTRFVVLDTAPAGHTLLLLAPARSYLRDVVSGDEHEALPLLGNPLTQLQDPVFARIVLVTVPEPTPVAMTARLQSELRRIGIEPFAWVINASLATPNTGSMDPALKQRIETEFIETAIVLAKHATRLAVVPWMIEEPIGPERLLALARGR